MRISRSRALACTAAVGAVIAASGLVSVVARAASAGCGVAYTVSSQWPGGFTANISVTNLGDPISSWTLVWSFTAGQTVTQG